MMHDALMLNPDQIRFTQDGAEFTGQVFDPTGEALSRRKKVFTASCNAPDGDRAAGELALKQFIEWCHDHRVTPVRA